MDLVRQLDDVIEEVRNAKKVKFSASAMINREDLLSRLEQLRAAVPEQLKQAGTIMDDQRALLQRCKQEADDIIARAEAERESMLDKAEVVKAAHRKAGKIIEEAKQRAHELRLGAEDYVDSRLASFEVVLQKTMAVVNRGRESLKGRPGQPVEMDEEMTVQPTSIKVKKASRR